MIRIDPAVGSLTMLRELLIDAERIEEPPVELVAQGCSAIVAYLGQIKNAMQTLHLHVPNFRLVTFPPELIASKQNPVPQVCVSLPSGPACPSCSVRSTRHENLRCIFGQLFETEQNVLH